MIQVTLQLLGFSPNCFFLRFVGQDQSRGARTALAPYGQSLRISCQRCDDVSGCLLYRCLLCTPSPKPIPSPVCRVFFQGSHLAQPVGLVLPIIARARTHRGLRFIRPSRTVLNLPKLQAIHHLLIKEFRRRLYHPWSRPISPQSHFASLQTSLLLPEPRRRPISLR